MEPVTTHLCRILIAQCSSAPAGIVMTLGIGSSSRNLRSPSRDVTTLSSGVASAAAFAVIGTSSSVAGQSAVGALMARSFW